MKLCSGLRTLGEDEFFFFEFTFGDELDALCIGRLNSPAAFQPGVDQPRAGLAVGGKAGNTARAFFDVVAKFYKCQVIFHA